MRLSSSARLPAPLTGETRARRIVGPPPEVVRMPEAAGFLVDDELVPAARPYGQLEYRRCKILSIR